MTLNPSALTLVFASSFAMCCGALVQDRYETGGGHPPRYRPSQGRDAVLDKEDYTKDKTTFNNGHSVNSNQRETPMSRPLLFQQGVDREVDMEIGQPDELREDTFPECESDRDVGQTVKTMDSSFGRDDLEKRSHARAAKCCVVKTIKDDVIADCAHCKLSFVPDNLPTNTTILLLSYNCLTQNSLYYGVFSNFSELLQLNMSYNHLKNLPDGVFDGLNKLQVLNLTSNHIKMTPALKSSSVFSPVNQSLRVLAMKRNNPYKAMKHLVYPDCALSVLGNLEELYIDGLPNKTFGTGFSRLTKLRTLDMRGFKDGFCDLSTLTNDTFRNLASVCQLKLADCKIASSGVQANALAPLTQLQYLDLTNNFLLGFSGLKKLMYGLRNNTYFKHLKIQRIHTRFAPCVVIFKAHTQHLRGTGLEVIEVQDNGIEMIEEGALKNLPSTFKYANVTNNRIMFGAYWKDLRYLHGFIVLEMNGAQRAYEFPEVYPPAKLHCTKVYPKTDADSASVNDTKGRVEPQGNRLPAKASNRRANPPRNTKSGQNLILQLPPKLKHVELVGYGLSYNIKNEIEFHSYNALESANLSQNMFQHMTSPIKGLNGLKILDLSDCYITEMTAKFFKYLGSLEHLYLNQNLLGDSLYKDENGLFRSLTSLKSLHLPLNNIYRLHLKSFQGLNSLRELDISANRINQIHFSIRYMNFLQNMDFHKNSLSRLPSDFTDQLTHLQQLQVNVRVDMRQNTISCECDNLQFLEWVVSSRVFGKNYTLYYCHYSALGINKEVDKGYEETVQNLRRMCGNKAALFLGILAGTVLCVGCFAAVIIYRFRWTLRYWYHMLKLLVSSNAARSDNHFEYDVFISYAHEDEDFVVQEVRRELEAKRDFRLFVHGQMFLAGRHIADNIIKAVQGSRKTLVIVTKSMLQSYWCTYELQMARHEAIRTSRTVLIFMFKERVRYRDMTPEFLDYVKTNSVLMYPINRRHMEAFWDKVADDLRSI